MQITRADVIWNYAASFLRITANALLLPFILRMMSGETVGIWSIFMTVTAFSSLLDFGFGPSFTRNVTYIFSGVRTLQINGVEKVDNPNVIVDFSLLKGAISAMRWFYLRMASILFLMLATLGTYYVHYLMKNYTGDPKEVYISWIILCLINSYSLYTFYYDSLLAGKGLIKRSKQIVVVGQSVYLIIAAILVLAGKNLIAIVSAQAFSVLVIRWLSNKAFFTREIRRNLNNSSIRDRSEILKAISPNAIKIGLTSIGSFMVQRSAIIIGALFLPLNVIASYGITIQLVSIISVLALIYSTTYQPKISQLFVNNDKKSIKGIYLTAQAMLVITFIITGFLLLAFGDLALQIIGSKTPLIPGFMVFILLVVAMLESNHSLAGSILLSKNEVPFFKASILAGTVTVILLLLFFRFLNLNLWAMILAPGIANIYNNWRWPSEVYKKLNILSSDSLTGFKKIYRLIQNEK